MIMIAVTGANGFIGSVLVKDLNLLGQTHLICVDTISPKDRPQPLSNKKFNQFYSSEEFLNKIRQNNFGKTPLTAIFHMGACSSTTETDVAYLKKNNTEYTQHLFQYCARHQIPFLYASSGAVYGDGQLGFSDETPTEEFQPLNPYGRSKSEFDVWAMKQKLTPPHWYGFRFFNVYGPNEYHKNEMASLIYKAYHQILETGELKLFKSHNPQYKDGEQLRDFIYVKDVSRWMIEIFQSLKVQSGIYNMGTGQSRTWLDLATAVFKSLDKDVKIQWMDIPINIRHQYQYFTEAKMDKLMGQRLSPSQWTLEKGIKDYVKNYLCQEDPTY